tara:strand:- start:1638 stop:2060 length:423 start_codon:yes stop_codon:yes gene_type:complete
VKQRRLIIQSAEQIALVGAILGGVDLDGSVEVVIRPYKKNRSFEQNRLYWKWIGIIADEIGDTQIAMHEIFKRKFLVPILAIEAPFYNLLMVVANGGTEDDRKELSRLISTSRLPIREFSLYLDQIDKHAASLSIALPQP